MIFSYQFRSVLLKLVEEMVTDSYPTAITLTRVTKTLQTTQAATMDTVIQRLRTTGRVGAYSRTDIVSRLPVRGRIGNVSVLSFRGYTFWVLARLESPFSPRGNESLFAGGSGLRNKLSSTCGMSRDPGVLRELSFLGNQTVRV